jgi:hypothetical protein
LQHDAKLIYQFNAKPYMPESAEIAITAIVLVALVIIGVLLIKRGTQQKS